MSRPMHADELRHRPAGPPSTATDGRWIVEHAVRQPGGPPDADPRFLVTWSLVLRHADDDHRERADTHARQATVYEPGQTVYGRVVVNRDGRFFKRAAPRVGGER